MDTQTFLGLARDFMSLPTAPFHEHFVCAAVEAFAAARPGLTLHRDRVGNLLLHYSHPRARQRSRLIATAHLDHPGLGFPRPLGRGEYFFEKLGGVDAAQAVGSPVRLYDLRRPLRQRICRGLVHCRQQEGETEGFVVRVPDAEVGPGWFGMWDLAPLRRRGPLLYGRACDDLAGVVAGLSCLDELLRLQARVRAGVLLTRAEEVGFGGMLEAAHSGWLDPEATYLNLECSSARVGAAISGGAIVRVGDRSNLFDPHLSSGVALVAAELAQAEPDFRFQRKLMDGGSCEAAVLRAAGLHTAALAIPLGNYHNKGETGMAPEFVHLDDALAMARLLVRLALEPGGVQTAGARAATQVATAMATRRRRHTPRLLQTINRNF